jgi:DNA-binding MarR family transcriptional regulator
MPTDVDLANAVSELRLVLGQLLRQLRSENALSLSHLAVLGRLDRSGPQTTSRLAAAERMRPQSMAQTLTELRTEGLVQRRPDPTDGRQILVELSDAGKTFLAAERQRREGWLSQAIDDELTSAEQELLVDVVPLLRRLAELDVRPTSRLGATRLPVSKKRTV